MCDHQVLVPLLYQYNPRHYSLCHELEPRKQQRIYKWGTFYFIFSALSWARGMVSLHKIKGWVLIVPKKKRMGFGIRFVEVYYATEAERKCQASSGDRNPGRSTHLLPYAASRMATHGFRSNTLTLVCRFIDALMGAMKMSVYQSF